MTVIARSSLRLAASAILLALATAVVPPASVDGQVARAGQTIAPVYEGWESNADGSFNLVFGYLNRNWEEEFHLPIGPANSIEPNGSDQGQPTYFFPRRNRIEADRLARSSIHEPRHAQSFGRVRQHVVAAPGPASFAAALACDRRSWSRRATTARRRPWSSSFRLRRRRWVPGCRPCRACCSARRPPRCWT